MILTPDEIETIIHARARHPHQLLGMHPLGDGSGVVVRAYLPDAARERQRRPRTGNGVKGLELAVADDGPQRVKDPQPRC
jgi:hypothetical protein